LGVITPAQYRTASSNIALSFVWLTAIFSGKFLATSRFYQVIGELAHKKEQLRKHGEEDGNSALVKKYRTELAALSPRAQN
jgi:protease PrsW